MTAPSITVKTIDEARRTFGTLVNQAVLGEVTVLTYRGVPAAALISLDADPAVLTGLRAAAIELMRAPE